MILVTRVFMTLLQAACLAIEGRETTHFGNMPLTMRLVKRAFRIPPIYINLPARFGYLSSHLRAPLYEHLYYWTRSEYFRGWTWNMVAYPTESPQYNAYELIFPILTRWSALPELGPGEHVDSLLFLIQKAHRHLANENENLLASIEAFFLQHKAERYHCISTRALKLLYNITNYESSERARALRESFPVFTQYVRNLWSTYLNMPKSPHVDWVPLGFYPFTYSRAWCRKTYTLYRSSCADAGIPRRSTAAYRYWLRKQQQIYTPSEKIAVALYTACANRSMLTDTEARTIFLGMRTRTRREPIYICNNVRTAHKKALHVNIVPPYEDDTLRWQGYETAYPIRRGKLTLHRLSDKYVTMNRLAYDAISLPRYALMRGIYRVPQIAGVYELARTLEYAYRIPNTPNMPYRMFMDLSGSPIYVTNEDHLYKPCLYPAACLPLPGSTEDVKIAYDEFHLAFYTPTSPVALWAAQVDPWITQLAEFDIPSHVHEIALLYAEAHFYLTSFAPLPPAHRTNLAPSVSGVRANGVATAALSTNGLLIPEAARAPPVQSADSSDEEGRGAYGGKRARMNPEDTTRRKRKKRRKE